MPTLSSTLSGQVVSWYFVETLAWNDFHSAVDFLLLILTSFNYEYGPQNLPRRDQYQCLLETLQNFFHILIHINIAGYCLQCLSQHSNNQIS